MKKKKKKEKRILDIKSYIHIQLQSCYKEALDDVRTAYVNQYNENAASLMNNEMKTWKKVRNEQFIKDAIDERLNEDKRYQALLVCCEDKVYEEWIQKEYDEYVKIIQDSINLEEQLKNYLISEFISGPKAEAFIEKLISKLDRIVYKYFSSSSVTFLANYENNSYEYYERLEYLGRNRSTNYKKEFCENYDGYIEWLILNYRHKKKYLYNILKDFVINRKFVAQNISVFNECDYWDFICAEFKQNEKKIIDALNEKYTLDYVIHLMNTENPNYVGTLSDYENYELKKKLINEKLLQTLPENYIDLFPFARTIHRKFILHIGGTNSGKTYSAMQELKDAETGIYLGPLRLLAFEQYDKLNKSGVMCNLLTGEEKKEVPNATHQASTIEMLNFSTHYDVAVIDEAQLISDSFRGGAWTNAIIGVYADKIHICAASEAEKVIKKIIESCGDEYEVKYHERNTPLIVEEKKFSFEKDIRKGDALIVFSKKSVHAVANELKRTQHIKSSVIYGALPYDVRQNEVDKFANGITDVVVTTDAIGLGMNLPIKRVVFLEIEKFDGIKKRVLNAKEIKQIAGRAGRYGIFDEGYVNTINSKGSIKYALNENLPDITTEEVFIRLPEMIVNIEGKLSTILEQWEKMKVKEGFTKADITSEKYLCSIAEEYTDDKKLIYDFITIPFDEKKPQLLSLWERMLKAKINDEHLSLHIISPIYSREVSEMGLQELEDAYEICDLIFYYNEKFEESLESAYVMEEKEEISKAIITLLDKQKLPTKKCKRCGRILAWDSHYNICDKCYNHRSYYGYRRYY